MLVSPTHDKIIINHHEQYFHKFTFGQSYHNVKKESVIYKLLERDLSHFQVSQLTELNDHNNDYCHFKLSPPNNKEFITNDVPLALVEFFNISRTEDTLFSDYLSHLKNRYMLGGFNNDSVLQLFEKWESSELDNRLPLGLVHRDFKPWNISDAQGLLIYDFEEAISDGIPLEDLFNYTIDPVIRYVEPEVIIQQFFSQAEMDKYQRYLKELYAFPRGAWERERGALEPGEDSIDWHILLYCYLIERMIFWHLNKQYETAEQYLRLLEKLK